MPIQVKKNQDGSIRELYVVDENWIRNGPYESYHENGQLQGKRTYRDGKINGPYESCHEDGRLYEKCTYRDGRREGPYESYHENGRMYEKCTYRNGEIEGSYETYDPNGLLCEKGGYVDVTKTQIEKKALLMVQDFEARVKSMQNQAPEKIAHQTGAGAMQTACMAQGNTR